MHWSKSLILGLAFLSILGFALADQKGPKPAVKIEVRKAETSAAEGLVAAKVHGTDQTVYLHKKAVLTNPDIAEVQLADTDQPAVDITFTEAGKKKMAKASEDHQDKPLAIVVDGKVIAAPVVRGKIGEKARVNVKDRAEAKRIVEGLQRR